MKNLFSYPDFLKQRDIFVLGHVFSDPEIISDSLLPGMCTGYVKDEMMVRVRGLPWQVSDHEVASFFRGLNIGRFVLCHM